MRRSVTWFVALLLMGAVTALPVFSAGSKEAPAGKTGESTLPKAASKYPMSDVPNMTAKSVLPIVAEPAQLTLGIRTMPNVTDYENNYLTKYLEQKTGIDIKFEFLPNAVNEAVSKIDLAIAAGSTLPDLLYVTALSSDKVQQYGQGGYFADLTSYYSKYAFYYDLAFKGVSPDYMKYLKQVITSEDGKIYCVPNVDFSITNAYRQEYHLNKTWLNALGLQFPRTTDELYNVLKAFKTKDPNGNGKADEIPLIWSQKNSFSGGSANILDAFEYMSASGLLLAGDGTLQLTRTTEGYREGLRYIRRLVSEGLISPLSYTMTTAELRTMLDLAKGETPYIGGFIDAMVLCFAANSARKYDFQAFESLLRGPGGKAYSTYYPFSAAASNFISNKSKVKEIAFRLMDYMYEQETAVITRFGEEAKHWKKVDASVPVRFNTGLRSFYDIIVNFWGSSQSANWNIVVANGPLVQWTRGDTPWVDPKNPTPTEYGALLTTKCVEVSKAPGAQPEKVVLSPIFTIGETAEIAELLTTLNTYMTESEAKFALGEKNLDADWNTYLSELKKIGVDRYLKIATDAYRRMNK
jgi:putative aldouronate transport system substrate-binding protein